MNQILSNLNTLVSPGDYLLQNRIVYVDGRIDNDLSKRIVKELLYLESIDPHKDILMFIMSPGGYMYGGFAIYDTMQIIKPNVKTVCIGRAMSFGAVLLCAGQKKERYIAPNARVMIHQPSNEISKGKITDIEITTKASIDYKKLLIKVMSKHTGKTYREIEEDLDRDNYLSAHQAIKYGLADKIYKG